MKTIRFLGHVDSARGSFEEGDLLELPDSDADSILDANAAVLASDSEVASAGGLHALDNGLRGRRAAEGPDLKSDPPPRKAGGHSTRASGVAEKEAP